MQASKEEDTARIGWENAETVEGEANTAKRVESRVMIDAYILCKALRGGKQQVMTRAAAVVRSKQRCWMQCHVAVVTRTGVGKDETQNPG